MTGSREMEDQWGRTIDSLRLSVTDSCNLGCIYCRLPGCSPLLQENLTDEEIFRVLSCFQELGIQKLKITGGEPLLRPGIGAFLERLLERKWFSSVTLTTNGQHLKEYWPVLSRLDSINVSLDSLQEAAYHKMTRGGELAPVREGLRQGLEGGYQAFKLNVVLVTGYNDGEIPAFLRLAAQSPLAVRFIELMPLGEGSRYQGVPRERILQEVDRLYPGWKWSRSRGNGPARYLEVPGIPGRIGFIDAVGHPFCSQCNRIRMDAAGKIFLCLEQEAALDVKAFLQGGLSRKGFLQQLREAVWQKPEKNHFASRPCPGRKMYQIGG